MAQLPETLHRRLLKGLEIGEQLPLAVEQAPTVQGAQVALVHTIADHTVEVQGQVGLHGAEFSGYGDRGQPVASGALAVAVGGGREGGNKPNQRDLGFMMTL